MTRVLLFFLIFVFAIVLPSLPSVSDSSTTIPSLQTAPLQRESLPKATVLGVIDGDTLTVRYQSKKEHLRLIGIDTPESRENDKLKRDARRYGDSQKHQLELGKAATEYTTAQAVRGALLTLEFDVEQRDRYGRLLAYAYLPNGKMLNALIIAEGYAKTLTVPPNVRYADTFRALMREARKAERGLWQSKKG